MARVKKFIAITLLGMSSVANAIDLTGTVFEKAAIKHGVEAKLLYSVALAESATGRGDGNISPWPWALRTLKGGPHYETSLESAKLKLDALLAQHGRNVDVGMMQINLRWHGDKVSSPDELLDPAKNVDVGAGYLAQCISSAPGDLELGIGRYYTWSDETRARNYGSRILAIYRNLDTEGI
ncbi:transglycosylase SLT domain-containing protein [Vibrio parahaemolyticus]|uniref:transglycosylase SLT domain-containing protein n=1 Tax=Vibrio parahaemolyticus TaxID=670 RepID=UPI000B778742|nr:transglycosylase SLT domain-containing protein [Vibrio parahaemolyticus]OXD00639.1 transglycosylase [Vibrio parahaemolyticus]